MVKLLNRVFWCLHISRRHISLFHTSIADYAFYCNTGGFSLFGDCTGCTGGTGCTCCNGGTEAGVTVPVTGS